MIYIGTRLKDVKEVPILHSARIRNLEHDTNSLWRKYTIKTTSLKGARAASAIVQVAVDAFTLAMRAVMDALVPEFK